MNNNKAIEDFLIVKGDKLQKAPLLFIFGAIGLELSDFAAKAYKNGYCRYILISGNYRKKINTTEAEWQAKNLIKKGVPKDKILLEKKASNSYENVVFSKKVIQKQFKKIPSRIIVVCQVFHGRRQIMTLRKNFPKNVKYSLQPIQTESHYIKNWNKNQKLRKHVLEELGKIGEYTLKGDIAEL